VATEGQLFERTIHGNINDLLNSNQAFENLRTASAVFATSNSTPTSASSSTIRSAASALFASHPRFHDRLEAIAGSPAATHRDDRSALTLFEDPEGTEKEMTEFLTAWMHHMRTLAASQQG
jgi:hypothetical protein